ncbi:ABC transporter permease [Boseaceae bacterium BT-24-1]|nr:ABC transporter permease [Boseaceae bacterium BT-24-1]
MALPLFIEQILNGLQSGVMLFLIASGLTLVLGIMNFVNLAHGSFYMIGAFAAVSFQLWTGSFFVAAMAACISAALAGLVVEFVCARRLYARSHLDQVLVTFGLIYVFNESMRMIFGPQPLASPIPPFLNGSLTLLPGLQYPLFRLTVIGVGLVVAAVMSYIVMRTRLGMLIRAGASDRGMIAVLGVNIRLLYSLLFALGAALAALAGLMAGPLYSVNVGMGENILIMTLVVIVVGGIGSLKGAFYAAIIIGLIDTLGRLFLPSAIATIAIYIFMAAVLFVRPRGLFASSAPPQVEARASDDRVTILWSLSKSRRSMTAWFVGLCMVALALVPTLSAWLDDPFLLRLFLRVVIFALMVLSLDLVAGFGGLVSFGHAAFVGTGAYAVAILGWHVDHGEPLLLGPIVLAGTHDALLAWPLAIASAAAMALLIGAVALRTSGLYFIMSTLAFAQMLFYLASTPNIYGGEDGLQISQRSTLPFVDLGDRPTLYYLALSLLALCLFLCWRLINSRFGMIVQACRQNERRVRALGVRTYLYKLLLFVISGMIAGIAGVLLANSELLVSPADLSWARSGSILIMAIFGGLGTLFGSVIGAVTYLMLEFTLSEWTHHWQIVFGPLLILFVLLARRGLFGLVLGRGSGS